ncbi:MAG: ABC transporter ATP-binding protein, partial [Thermoproteota archaeon]
MLLELRGVWKRYTGDWVLREVELELRPGDAVAVVGPNGSGKTTLLRVASGLTAPSRGRVLVSGRPPSSPEARRAMGVVGHSHMLYRKLTVRENLSLFSRLYGVGVDWALVESLGLDRYLDRRVEELSFGWRKRADLARALLHRPRLLPVDEPLT